MVLQKKWITAMRRDKFSPKKSSRICSKHFSNECYDTNPWSSKKKLKDDAVPTIFEFPDHLSKTKPARKPPIIRNNNNCRTTR